MERLFVYGTLQPGGPNEHVMSAIGGEWQPAVIKGTLHKEGWGAKMGYQGLVLDDNGSDVDGYVFTSAALSTHWDELDAFEGKEYSRVVAAVTLPTGEQVPACVYVLCL
ncbi:MAG: gamma-glutamylcyclotransferase family protein [Cyanobacteria bacterium P01_D01_bin.105]